MPPVYRGPFGKPQAERLLWRAGFGPRPGEAERLAKLGLERAVHSLTHPGRERLRGPKPHDDNGHSLAPLDAWGHDQLWWLDRMVRTTPPLAERMTLVWHDWFATSREGVDSARLMIRQNKLFRKHALGPFSTLLTEVTRDPAMLLWLSGVDNEKDAPNENYGREMMELFTIGADRGGYTEKDVREQARALTGWRNDWNDTVGPVNFRYDKHRHDPGSKRIFGVKGHFDWRDSCRLCVHHRLHPSFFVTKLWSYFVPVPPAPAVASALERLYVSSGNQIRSVLEAILCSPEFHDGPRMVKPPVVMIAGMLRALGKPITGEQWVWLADGAGQRLYGPPDVSGWDDKRWLDSNTIRARWDVVNYAVEGRTVYPDSDAGRTYPAESPEAAVAAARTYWLDPSLTPETGSWLTAFARDFQPPADTTSTPAWQRTDRAVKRAQRQNALRHLIAVSADYQTS